MVNEYVGTNGLRVDGFYGLGQWMYQLVSGTLTYEIPEPENPTTEKEKPSTDKEKTTTEKKTETTKTTTGTPKSGTTTTKKDEGTISPKGGVQTGIHSHELLYAAIAAGLAGAAILVHRRRKKKNI